MAATRADIDYLCDAANEFFPDARLRPDDVIATWAGLRPLVASDAGRASDVSREHHVIARPEGIVVIAGGKLTTYRLMAKEAVDAAGRLLASTNGHQRIARCTTRSRPLPGAQGLPETNEAAVAAVGREVERLAGVSARVATHLSQTYGRRAIEVARRGTARPALLERIDPDLPYVWAEVEHAVSDELARTVEDVLVRRIPLCLRGRNQGLDAAPRVAEVLGAALGWSPAEAERQQHAYQAYVRRSRQFATAG